MNQDFEKRKIIETLVDPNISVILAKFEKGEKDSAYLTEKLGISLDEIKERLSYVIAHGFATMNQNDDKIIFRADMVDQIELWKVMRTLQVS